MKHSRNLVGACVSAALLAACGGGSVPSSSTPTSIAPVHAPHNKKKSQTFNYTGAEQTFKVPARVKYVTVTAQGAGSGGGTAGGLVRATIPVTPGESLAVFVGGEPSGGYSDGTTGGFNGGGDGGMGYPSSSGAYPNGGAGASDVRQGGDGLANRVVVAGGAGGGYPCDSYNKIYGDGGGLAGGNGYACTSGNDGGAGGGGTQNAGGNGGAAGYGGSAGLNGTVGIGGDGGDGCGGTSCGSYYGGGGGGGGYYGGGGGGGGGYGGSEQGYGGGGGGGSGFTEASAKKVKNLRGKGHEGSGTVFISW
jgi:hypothetical protein